MSANERSVSGQVRRGWTNERPVLLEGSGCISISGPADCRLQSLLFYCFLLHDWSSSSLQEYHLVWLDLNTSKIFHDIPVNPEYVFNLFKMN